MPAALARLQTADGSNPVLDLFAVVDGALGDVYAASFQIFDATASTPVQVYPATPGDRITVNVADDAPTGARLGVGRYAATWAVLGSEPLGAHFIRWFFQPTSTSPERTFTEAFEVLPAGTATSAALESYVMLSEMRDEGVTLGMASDDFLVRRIALASRFVEAATKRFFCPRAMSIKVNGRGGAKILIDDPIIAVSEVLFDTTPWAPSATQIELDLVRVYNRHISQGLLSPDDRNNPKIELFSPSVMLSHYGSSRSWSRLVFPVGQQNVTITGVFGYTEPDGASPTGRTPDLVVHVTKLLVMRELDRMSRTANRFDRHNRHRLTSERTRDQAYTLEALGAARGFFTGDPEIDSILALFLRPPALGAA